MKLPQKLRKNLEFQPVSFAASIKSPNFVVKGFYERFENRAEELDHTKPTYGYQLAYNEALVEAFGMLVTNYIGNDAPSNLPTFKKLIDDFDSLLMDPYFEARKRYGLEDDIVRGMDALTPEMLASFESILNQATELSAMNVATAQFESGEITLDSIADQLKTLNKDNLSRYDAQKLAVYAECLEQRNEERSWLSTIFSFRIHFRELDLIKEMRALAETKASIKVLLAEATNIGDRFQKFKADVEEIYHNQIIAEEERREIEKEGSRNLSESKISKISLTESLEILQESAPADTTSIDQILEQTMMLDGENDPLTSDGDEVDKEDPFTDLNQSIIEGGDTFRTDEEDQELAEDLNEALTFSEEDVKEEDLDSLRIRVDLNQSDLGDNSRSNELSEKLIEEPAKDDLNRTR